MYEIECRLQICVYYCIPLRLIHSHHQSVLGDAGIVYQYVNASESCLYLFNYPMGILKRCRIRGKSQGFHSLGFKFRNQ